MSSLNIQGSTNIYNKNITFNELVERLIKAEETIEELKNKSSIVCRKKFTGTSVYVSGLDIKSDGGIYDIIFFAYNSNNNYGSTGDIMMRINNSAENMYNSTRTFSRFRSVDLTSGSGDAYDSYRFYKYPMWYIGDLVQRGVFKLTLVLLNEGNVRIPRIIGQAGSSDDYKPNNTIMNGYISGKEIDNITAIQIFSEQISSGELIISKRI